MAWALFLEEEWRTNATTCFSGSATIAALSFSVGFREYKLAKKIGDYPELLRHVLCLVNKTDVQIWNERTIL